VHYLCNQLGGLNTRFLLSRAQLLYQLQLLDSELDQTKRELAEIAAALGESDALKQARTEVERTKQELRTARTALQDLDLEVNGLANKIAQHEKLLYSGKAMSAKEAANLQDEVASLKRWHEKREEALLEAMVAVEEAEEAFRQAEARLSTIQADWAAGQEDLIQKQSNLETQVAELLDRRPTVAQGIAADDLNEYEDLRRRKAGRAVTVAKNGVCQACGVAASNRKIQQARAGVELAYCSTCGRILYIP